MSNKSGKWKTVIIILLVLACGVLGYGTKTFYDQKNEVTSEKDLLQEEMESYKTYAYIAIRDISMGEELVVDENVQLQQLFTGALWDLYWQPTGETQIASTDITVYTPIYRAQAMDPVLEPTARTYETGVVNLMTTLNDYDYIDVRIAFPDGSDYTVLSKKQIKNLSLKNGTFTMDLREDEIQYMTSATIDAYLHPAAEESETTQGAAYLYCVAYPNPKMQEPSVPDYPVKSATYDRLSKDNPNFVQELLAEAKIQLNKQVRMNLESRLGQITAEELAEVERAWTEQQSKFIAEINALIQEQQNQQ